MGGYACPMDDPPKMGGNARAPVDIVPGRQ
jgi:hypothetical protein